MTSMHNSLVIFFHLILVSSSGAFSPVSTHNVKSTTSLAMLGKKGTERNAVQEGIAALSLSAAIILGFSASAFADTAAPAVGEKYDGKLKPHSPYVSLEIYKNYLT